MTQAVRNALGELLDSRGTVVADGAMGTTLFAHGLQSGGAPELWNIEHAEKIAAVHAAYLDAGADIILTNTFGGTRSRLALHHLEERVAELNAAAVTIARGVAAGAGRRVLVAGSIGPTGDLFAPLGPLTSEEGVAIFAEQADALAAAGADVLWIETMSMPQELEAAVRAASHTGVPVVTTMSFDTNGHTMMGYSPAQLADWWRQADAPPVAIGANCGVGLGDVVLAAARIHAAAPEAIVVAKGNCGIPRFTGTTLVYPAGPEVMDDYARLAIDVGARIIGACCGSSPEHIRAIRKVVDFHRPGEPPTEADIAARLGVEAKPVAVAGARRDRRRDLREPIPTDGK